VAGVEPPEDAGRRRGDGGEDDEGGRELVIGDP
jgi:hypothetical protein